MSNSEIQLHDPLALAKIVTVAEMRGLEAEADAAGVSYDAMMEHAGRAVAEAVLARAAAGETTAAVLVGPGNNGGDGLVAARHLAAAGAAVKVYALRPLPEEDPKVAALREQSVFIVDAENDQRWRVLQHVVGGATVIVDALFGTGARLPLGENAAQMLERTARAIAARKARPMVVAVDCPSGTDCDTGQVDRFALRADVSVTFGAAKIGQFKFPAADYLGELIVADIGWPDTLAGWRAVKLELATAERARANLPSRPRDAHKYTFGKALVVAGCKQFIGAAYLAGLAAYRGGCGLVTLAVPEPIHPILAAQFPEATWLPLPAAGDRGVIAEDAAEAVLAALPRADALIIGPGWGTEAPTAAFLRRLLEGGGLGAGLPVLADADGLRLLPQIEGWPGLLPGPAVLTPHPGEMAALTGLATDEIQADRVGMARRFAAQWGHVVLLKGAFTVVAAPGGEAVVEPFATPALAKAGSGDVLSGLIGGLLAQGVPPFEAAVTGAYVHGRAAGIAAERVGTATSLVAGDLLAAVARAVRDLEQAPGAGN